MTRLSFFIAFAMFSDVCLTHRFCGVPRAIPATPTLKYTIASAQPVITTRACVDNFEVIQMAEALNRLQDNAVKDIDCGCFTSEIISKLVDALVVSTTRRNTGSHGGGSLLNVALADTDLLAVSV